MARRPLKSRGTRWAARAASRLAAAGVRPNTVSFLSVVFAGLAGACFVSTRHAPVATKSLFFVLGAVCIQLRLLCNLFDGMIAVEGGQKTKSGEIFNDLPDRIADPAILVSAGYAAPLFVWAPTIGWLAGSLAILTAYVRVLGGSTGVTQSFMGPMAKQHRMAILTAAALAAAALAPWHWHSHVMVVALGLVAAGCVVTAVRRTIRIVRELEAQ